MPYITDPTNSAAPADTDSVSTASLELRALKGYLQTQLTALNASIAAITPQSGEIRFGLTAPGASWLSVQASPWTILRATYPALTAWAVALGSPWGAGDGATTINMPYIQSGGTVTQASGVGAIGAITHGAVLAHTHPMVAYIPSSPNGFSGAGGAGQVSANTGSTGGTDNQAAGILGNFYIHI
jgi:hypothetical protein